MYLHYRADDSNTSLGKSNWKSVENENISMKIDVKIS